MLSLSAVPFSSGKGEAIETTLAALQVVPEPFRSFANTLVDICAYAGQFFSMEAVDLCLFVDQSAVEVCTNLMAEQPFPSFVAVRVSSSKFLFVLGSGNVLKVQQLLHICSEHYEAKEKEKEDDKDKKDKKDKDKKENAADMGSHQVN